MFSIDYKILKLIQTKIGPLYEYNDESSMINTKSNNQMGLTINIDHNIEPTLHNIYRTIPYKNV